MITDGFSLQGKSHIRKEVVCQDAHIIKKLKNGWYVLAVADGVGSAKHSEDGSKTATTSVAKYCMEHIQSDMKSAYILDALKNAFQIAYQDIESFCQNKNGNIRDYDTTLSVAIYTGTDVYYGHAGDGGIIIKDIHGKYKMITSLQKGVDGISVRPLRAGSDSWEFGKVEQKVAAVLLATDGMLDTLLPPLLNIRQMQELPLAQNRQMNIYVTLAEFFMNGFAVYQNRKIKNPHNFVQNFLNGDISNEQFNQCMYNGYKCLFDKNIATAICKTIESYNYSTWKINKVDDDKTIVFAINEGINAKSANSTYYAEPDWKALQQQFDRMAYPSLYSAEGESMQAEINPEGYERIKLENNVITPIDVKKKRNLKTTVYSSDVKLEQMQTTNKKSTKSRKIYYVIGAATLFSLVIVTAIVLQKIHNNDMKTDETLVESMTEASELAGMPEETERIQETVSEETRFEEVEDVQETVPEETQSEETKGTQETVPEETQSEETKGTQETVPEETQSEETEGTLGTVPEETKSEESEDIKEEITEASETMQEDATKETQPEGN